MAWIEKRTQAGRTTWRVQWRENGAKQQQGFDTAEAAEDFKAHVDAAKQHWPRGWVKGQGWADEVDGAGIPTFREYAERTIGARGRADERTREDYLRLLRLHVNPTMGDTRLDLVTRFDVSAVAEKMRAQKKSAKTIANVHALLSSILRDAVEDELIRRNPAKGALPNLPDVKTEDMVFLTPQEFATLAKHIPDGTDRDLARLLFSTGLRWSEATALQRRDVDVLAKQKALHVRRAWKRRGNRFELGSPKTNRSRRTVTLSAELVDMLLPYLIGDPSGFLFTTAASYPIRHSNFYNRVWLPAVTQACTCTVEHPNGEKCECPGVLRKRPGIHSLRHSHASMLIDAKVTLPAIQRRLGHESIQTTIDRYGHLMPDHADEVNAAVDAALVVV